MNAFGLVVLAGGLLALSVGGHAVIHSMDTEVRPVTGATISNQAPQTDSAFPGTHTPAAELVEGSKVVRIEDVRALHTEIVGLKKEVAALRTRFLAVERITSTESYTRNENTDDDTDDAPVVASQLELNGPAYEQIDTMNTQFSSQDIDTNWSPDASEFIRQALGERELAGTDVLNIECRATQCRLEVAHEDRADQDLFVDIFPSMVIDVFSRTTFNHILDDNGRSRTVIFLDREDYSKSR